MAKEEIPDRMTKSVPLAGGMQDDVPEFLQEFPSLAYVENGRFRKANEVEKTLPETDFSPVSAPFGDSLAVDVAGDTLLAVGVDGAREYTTASGWRTLAGSSTDLTSKSDVASSSQAGGAMHFDWAKSTIGDEFYVIAFETRSTSSAGAGSFNVVIESFTLGGTLIDREIIVNGRGPQVNATADGRVVVHYGLKYIFTNNLYVYDTTAKTSSIVHDYSSNPIDINEETPALIAIRSELSTVTGDTGQGDLPLGKAPPALETYNPIRMGLHPAGQNLWYKVSYRDGTTEDGAILWQDSAVTNHGVRLMKLGSDGQRSSGGSVVTVQPSTPVTASSQYFPLDVAVNYDGTEFCIWTLTGYRSSVPNTSSLVAKRYNHATPAAPTTSEVVDTGSFTIVNGTIAGPGFGGANIAYTRILGDEGNLQDTEDGRCAIKWGYLDDGDVWSDWGELPHHRLTSNLIPLSSSSLFACEQFGIFQPYQIPAIGSFGIENPPLPGLKSSTAIFVKAGDDGEVTPAATFDATTSKHTNFSMQEQNMFLGRMRVDSGSVYYCNRQQLQAEDFSGQVRIADVKEENWATCWHPGDFRGNLHSVDYSPEKIQTIRFGNSIILNTSIPQWYSGGDIVEMSVMEQPEIRYLDTGLSLFGGDGQAWTYQEPLNSDTDQWSSYQVVVGYTDATGHVHRSAPSFPIYVLGTTKFGTDVENRVLGYTYPMSIFEDDKYFVEVYSAKGNEIPQLSYSTFINKGLNWVSFQDSYLVDAADYDPVRTSEYVYTNSSLPVDPWPSFDQAVVTSRRMFAIEGDTLYFSKLFEANLPPEFNAVLQITFGQNRKLRAIGKIDDKVIVFEDNNVHAVYGDGPDNIGAGSSFIVDHLQTTMGCSDPESVIEIPEGLLFYSAGTQEFHLINRDLNIIDVGKAVQDLTVDIDIKASTLFPMEHEVRWYITGGPTNEFGASPTEPPTRPPRPRYTNVLPTDPVLVYNYHYDKWTVISGQPAVSATVFENDVVRIDDSWNVFRTSEQWANSNLVTYRLPWLRAQDLQNFARFRELDFLGKYLSDWADNGDGHEAGDIKITFRYDYEANGLYHEYLWKANTQFNPDDGDRLQFSAHPGKPKCQAIQVTVEEVPTVAVDDSEPTYTNGRGFVLSGLDLLYSLKRGLGSKSLGRSRRK